MISLSTISGKYIGQSFNKCSCMDLLYGWYSDLGINMPNSYEHLNLVTYFKAWETDKKQTIEVMFRLFKSLGKHAEITDLKVHDLLAVQNKDNIYAGIYINIGMVIASSIQNGVRAIHLGKYHKVILNRRLL